MIPREYYFRQDILEKESETLFKGSFEFVCLASEVTNDRDFVSILYHDCSVVVQNFRGELRAFQNICTHRFNTIQTEDRGNRALVCRYHGWRFDDQGCPLGAERRVIVPVDGDLDLCLPRYAIETCGQFVFIKRNDDPATLRDFLGSYYHVLEEISAHIGPVTHFKNVLHEANWKVLVENVIDNVHCPILHRETFVAFGFCRKPVEDTSVDGPHSSWHVPRVEIGRERVRARALAHLDAREYKHNSFYHIYIFPNLFVASTEGASFYIGHALPVAPEQTILRARYLAPHVELSGGSKERQALLNEQAHASGLKIVDEDKEILEQVQRGIRMSKKPGAISAGEPRIEAFISSYMSLMRDAEARAQTA